MAKTSKRPKRQHEPAAPAPAIVDPEDMEDAGVDTTAGERASAAQTIGDAIRFLPQEYVPRFLLAHLEDFPGNPKNHNASAIGESIDTNGWYGVIIAQRSTRRVLAGHGRRDTLIGQGQEYAPVLLLDCDDATARRILLSDNETPSLGGYNLPRLASFLETQHAANDLRGTGFDDERVRQLLHIPNFQPASEDEQGKLDERDPIECPKCHHKFNPK